MAAVYDRDGLPNQGLSWQTGWLFRLLAGDGVVLEPETQAGSTLKERI